MKEIILTVRELIGMCYFSEVMAGLINRWEKEVKAMPTSAHGSK